MKKREWIAVGIMLSGLVCLAQNQQVGLTVGIQGVYGELSDGMTSVATPQVNMQYYFQPVDHTDWMYGAELRLYSSRVSAPKEEGWLSDYDMSGSGQNLMFNVRYIFLGSAAVENRTGLFRSWAQAGLGAHYMRYSNNLNETTISDAQSVESTESVFAGAIGLGLGAQYYLTHNWALQFDFAGQFTGNDYLDGVSGLGDAKDWPIYAGLGAAYHF